MQFSTTTFPLRCVLPLFVLAIAFHARAEAPKLASGVRVLKDLPYVKDGHENQKLDLYLPAKPTGRLLVSIHGGAWRAGSKGDVDAAKFLAMGFSVASIEYRFSQHAIFPAQIEDCKAAIRWLRANSEKYGYSPDQVAAIGGSAGGHLVALLATTGTMKDFDVGENLDQSSAIKCGIDFFGPTDFPGWKPPTEIPLVQRSGKGSCIEQLFGGPLDEKLEIAKTASPVTWVSEDSAPLFIIHGTKDPLVGAEQSELLAEKLEGAGVEVVLDIIEGGGHGGKEFFANERLLRMMQFLDKHLADSE